MTELLPFGPGAWVFIALYVASLLLLGWAGRAARREDTLQDFYLAGRGFGFVVLLLTLYATQYSGNTFFGGRGRGLSARLRLADRGALHAGDHRVLSRVRTEAAHAVPGTRLRHARGLPGGSVQLPGDIADRLHRDDHRARQLPPRPAHDHGPGATGARGPFRGCRLQLRCGGTRADHGDLRHAGRHPGCRMDGRHPGQRAAGRFFRPARTAVRALRTAVGR